MNGRKLRVMRWFLLLLATLCLFFIAHKRLTFAFIETGCKCMNPIAIGPDMSPLGLMHLPKVFLMGRCCWERAKKKLGRNER